MSRAHCSIRQISAAADAPAWNLSHGDIIGRMLRADMRIDDPRVSEAHALISLRGAQLRLLALRGRIHVGTNPQAAVTLTPGLRFSLGPDLDFVVEAVHLPESVLALEGDGLVRQALSGVLSLHVAPAPRLTPGLLDDADAVLWGEDDLWRYRLGAGDVGIASPGHAFTIGERAFRFVAMPIAGASERTTLAGSLPLRIVAGYDTVQVHQGEASVHISGLPARIVSELVDYGVAVEWDTLAAAIWPGADDRASLRARFDMALSRLRRKLRDAGIRDDFIVTSGHGHIEIVLRSHDVVDDRL